MTEKNWKEEHDKLDHMLSQMTNLVAALQVVSWDIAQLTPDQTISTQSRDALVGVSDALENLVREA